MKLKMYCVYDIKAKVYNRPFYAINEQVMRRMMVTASRDKQTEVAAHPEDFYLYYVGEFDDSTGEIVVPVSPQVEFKVIDIMEANENA